LSWINYYSNKRKNSIANLEKILEYAGELRITPLKKRNNSENFDLLP